MAESDPSDKFIQDFGLDQLECSGEEHSHPTVLHKTVGKGDVVQSSKTEVKDSEFQTFSDVEPQVTEEASQYENAQVGHGATGTMDADNKPLELINESKVSECKEVNDVITDKELAGRELAQPTASNDSVIQNKNTGNSTDVEPQQTEEAGRYENAHGTTITMDADDESSELINKSKVSECKEVNGVITKGREPVEPTAANYSVVQDKNTANTTDVEPQPTEEASRYENDHVTTSTMDADDEASDINNKSKDYESKKLKKKKKKKKKNLKKKKKKKKNTANFTDKKDPATSDESDILGNAKLAPNPSDVQDSGYGSDGLTKKSLDLAAGIPVVQQQSRICSAGNTIEKQNDKNSRDILEKKTKQSIVECDSKETMARVLALIHKMINKQLGDLEELEFGQCHLEKEHLDEFLSKRINAIVCKILKLSIGYTKNVTALIPFYCQIAYRFKSTILSLIFNDLKSEDIKVLFENLYENEEYEEIDMSYNKNIGPAGYENIGKIVKKHKVKTLKLADCDISDVDLHKLFDGMGDATNEKDMELDISHNRNIKSKGYEDIGKNVHKHEVRTLRLADCDISDEDLEHLFNGMGEAELEVLDISCTNNLTAKGFGYIGKQVANKRIKRLKLSDTQLNVETLTAFREEVKREMIEDSDGQQVFVEEIDVSYNSTMELEAYRVLGSMVKLFGVKKLSLAGCGISEEHLKDFRKEMKYPTGITEHTKMKSLNAGDNTSIGEGIVEIAKIVNECQLEELDISDCRFSANELKNFIDALGNAKLKCLYLGEKRRFDKYYIFEVCNLLPYIKETLRLQGTVRNGPRSKLQDKLDILRESKLEIKLDDDVTLRAQIKHDVANSS